MISATAERVSQHTKPQVNQEIEEETEKSLECLLSADPERLNERLRELDKEWDIERLLELNAAAIASTGILMAIFGKKKRLVLPLAVTGFLLQHAIQGWCPPIEIFRRLGFRTAREIDNERHAIKMMRGDYRKEPDTSQPKLSQVRQVLNAVEK